MPDRTCTVDACAKPAIAKGLCRTHYQRQWKTGSTEARRQPTDIERFMAQVQIQPNGCWHWTGHISRGYGQFRLRGARVRPHRAAYLLFIGEIPDGMQVDHECHNRDDTCQGNDDCLHRRCVNPDPAHLRAATAQQNVLAGRTPAAANAAKTHCPQGHPYDEANTYTYPSGGRACRRCMAIHDAERKATRTSVRTAVPSD